MAASRDWSGATREELLAGIAALETGMAALEARLAELERRQKSGGPPHGMPGNKPSSVPPVPAKPRNPRPHAFVRRRSTPTETVRHVPTACPECGTSLAGGWVQRTREVLELPEAPVRVIAHDFVARTCPRCARRVVARADADRAGIVGKQRLGVRLQSVIVALREGSRLPVATVRRILHTLYGIWVSVGEITLVCQRLAARGKNAVAAILDEVRQSPVIHCDETGWRENGANGYVWALSTPLSRYFVRGGRAGSMLHELLGDAFSGTLVSDFYVVYRQYDGTHQWCWAHLLRDIHELQQLYPDQRSLADWAAAVHALYTAARAEPLPSLWRRGEVVAAYQDRLLALCQEHLGDQSAPHRVLCERITKHIGGLFTFVGDPDVPTTNNAAERSLRHLVTARKISGGTRSPTGSVTKLRLATLLGTWDLRQLDPVVQLRQLLLSPQL